MQITAVQLTYALHDLQIRCALSNGLNGVQITLALYDQQLTRAYMIALLKKLCRAEYVLYRRFWTVGVQSSVYVICVGFPLVAEGRYFGEKLLKGRMKGVSGKKNRSIRFLFSNFSGIMYSTLIYVCDKRIQIFGTAR
jgi:hypothetical protein